MISWRAGLVSKTFLMRVYLKTPSTKKVPTEDTYVYDGDDWRRRLIRFGHVDKSEIYVGLTAGNR